MQKATDLYGMVSGVPPDSRPRAAKGRNWMGVQQTARWDQNRYGKELL